MSSDSVENRPKTPPIMSNGPTQDDLCSHMEIVSKMSVTISKDWIDALKNCGCDDCGEVLNEIVGQATKQNSHSVDIISLAGTCRLEGCFCGINEIRKALQTVIKKKQTKENNGILDSGELVNDQQSHFVNEKMETDEMSPTNSEVQMENSSLRKGDEVQNEVDNYARDQKGNDDISEFPQQNENRTSILRSGEEDSNPENFNHGDKNKKRERKLLLKNQEIKVIKNEEKDVGQDDLEKEATLKETEHSKNLNHEVKYPDLSSLVNTERSEKPKQQDRYQDLSTSKTTQNSENPKKAHHQDSLNYPGLHQNPTNNPEIDRICALMLIPSVEVDGDIFYYLAKCQNHELSRISKKCSVFELYKVEQKHKLAVEVKPDYQVESVVAEFRKLCDQATVHKLEIPGGVDVESLKNSVEAMTEFKDVDLHFMSKERVCKIVGSSKEVTKAKQILQDIIASNTKHGYDPSNDRTAPMTLQITTTTNQKEPARSVQWHPTPTASNVHQTRRSAFSVLNHSHDSLLLSALNLLTIEVKRDDLTRIHDMDVVVSCINHQLGFDGPMADKVIKAAGPNVKAELASHKSHLSFLHASQFVCTSGGNLRGVKALIHVVPPQLYEFPSNAQSSRDVLRCVFTNCFCYTNHTLGLNSICLTPIGLSSYGAEMVVNCFLDAVEMFISTVNSNSAAPYQYPNNLKHIQLVSSDSYCVGQLIRCIRQRLDSY